MNRYKVMRNRTAHFLIKLAFQAATLATAICAVHELDRIHHHLKKIEKAHEEKHRKLL